jgi:hypothetical protein
VPTVCQRDGVCKLTSYGPLMGASAHAGVVAEEAPQVEEISRVVLLIQEVPPRNGCRNARETVVL